MGTIEGEGTVLVRGKLPGGRVAGDEDVLSTLVHEGSHILVKAYGEHPGTSTDAGSFDRYKDEFRAYFVEPHGNFDGLTGAAAGDGDQDPPRRHEPRRPAAIRICAPPTGRGRRPPTRSASRSTRTPRPTASTSTTARTSTASSRCCGERSGRVEDAIFQIAVLSPAEREEAAGATLIASLVNRLPAPTPQRIRRALAAPASVGFGRSSTRTESPRVTAFLEAVTARAPDQIVEAYRHATRPTAARSP